jgi:hypothetical protein
MSSTRWELIAPGNLPKFGNLVLSSNGVYVIRINFPKRLLEEMTFEQWTDPNTHDWKWKAELVLPASESVVLPKHYLEVGRTQDTHEVVINHPDLEPDENGVGHLTFTPDQARNLAKLLNYQADESEKEAGGATTITTGSVCRIYPERKDEGS